MASIYLLLRVWHEIWGCAYEISFCKFSWKQVGWILENRFLVRCKSTINIFDKNRPYQVGCTKTDLINGELVFSGLWRICWENSTKLIREDNAKQVGRDICCGVWNRKITGIFAVKGCLNIIMADKKHPIYQHFSRRFVDHLNNWVFVLIYDFKGVCLLVMGIIPIPKCWRLRKAICENRVHLVTHHNSLIIGERNFYEHIKPVAYYLRKNRIKILVFSIDGVRDRKDAKHFSKSRRKTGQIGQISSHVWRQFCNRNTCHLWSPRIVSERLQWASHFLSAKPDNNIFTSTRQFRRQPSARAGFSELQFGGICRLFGWNENCQQHCKTTQSIKNPYPVFRFSPFLNPNGNRNCNN